MLNINKRETIPIINVKATILTIVGPEFLLHQTLTNLISFFSFI